jgi:hypothetical protein
VDPPAVGKTRESESKEAHGRRGVTKELNSESAYCSENEFSMRRWRGGAKGCARGHCCVTA